MLRKPNQVVTYGWLSLLSALAGCGGAQDSSSEERTLAGSSPITEQSRHSPPKLPSPTLAVPSGNELEFHARGIGVQIYACQATATGFAWVFQAPEATLTDASGRVVGKHYAGPTWEANDGSKVVAAKVAGVTVDASSVPWLLLQATSHAGDGRMSDVTYIQRLETTGGTAPNAGCDVSHVGDIARIDYSATYYFYGACK